jgi:hypothetical protein
LRSHIRLRVLVGACVAVLWQGIEYYMHACGSIDIGDTCSTSPFHPQGGFWLTGAHYSIHVYGRLRRTMPVHAVARAITWDW